MSNDQEDKSKGGFTVGELEGKMKKYGLEIALCVIFILTAIFALVWGGAMMVWSVLLCMIFAIVGVLVPKSTHKVASQSMRFICKEMITAILVGVVACLIGVFIPPFIFALVGLIAGKTIAVDARSHKPDSDL